MAGSDVFNPIAAQQAYTAAGQAEVGSSFTGKTFLFGWQLGGAYKLTDNLSAYAGARLLMARASYVGNVSFSLGGDPTVLSLNTEQKGFGVAPILGLDYKMERLNLALKYEFESKVEVENETSEFPAQFDGVASLARFKDGAKSQMGQPALLTAGAAYDVTPALQLSAGFHYFFDKDADYNGLEKEINSNTTEYLLGAEYALTDKWTVSAGGQLTNYDVTDDYNSNTGFIMSSYSLGGGLKYSASEYLALNLGVLWTNFDDYSKTASYNGISVQEEYERKSIAGAIGATFSF